MTVIELSPAIFGQYVMALLISGEKVAAKELSPRSSLLALITLLRAPSTGVSDSVSLSDPSPNCVSLSDPSPNWSLEMWQVMIDLSENRTKTVYLKYPVIEKVTLLP